MPMTSLTHNSETDINTLINYLKKQKINCNMSSLDAFHISVYLIHPWEELQLII